MSYAGAEFEVTDCPLSDEMTVMYDRSCEFCTACSTSRRWVARLEKDAEPCVRRSFCPRINASSA